MPMKTTVNLDDQLLRLARKVAVDRGITFREVLEEALRASVMDHPQQAPFSFRWTPVTGTGPPSVDVDDRDALYDLLEERP